MPKRDGGRSEPESWASPGADNANMSNIYDAITNALSAHWKAHANRNPQKLVLSSSQHADLMRRRKMTKTDAEAAQVDPARFMGVAIEIDDAAPGLLISVEGTPVAIDA